MSNDLVDKKYKWYLFDLGLLVKERALEAKQRRESMQPKSDAYMFEAGRLLAFNEVISMMQQQGEGFDIPLEELRLGDVIPDRDLV
jgi:hypothetical protein